MKEIKRVRQRKRLMDIKIQSVLHNVLQLMETEPALLEKVQV